MKIILTGATGYVGEGTLLELLKVDAVEKVLSVSRKPTGIKHEKLEEYLVSDFMQLKGRRRAFQGLRCRVLYCWHHLCWNTKGCVCTYLPGGSLALC